MVASWFSQDCSICFLMFMPFAKAKVFFLFHSKVLPDLICFSVGPDAETLLVFIDKLNKDFSEDQNKLKL